MKNILIGVCGIGNGHFNRQREVIDLLLNCNTNIVIASTVENKSVFHKLYPNIKVVTIQIPWVVCGANGVDFYNTLKCYNRNKTDYYKSFLEFSLEISKCFDNKLPDLIISDYEPNVAKYSYAVNRPLICMDQQSKFLFVPVDSTIKLSVEDEVSRLRFFFPKVDTRFISSFFNIKCDISDVIILPPLVKNVRRINVESQKILVYFSPYSTNTDGFEHILQLISHQKKYYFKVYTDLDYNDYKRYDNIKFKKIGDEFNDDFTNCKCIISSSGHQLISEAIENEVPLYIFPLNTYEQNYNCNVVEKLGLGKKIVSCNNKEFGKFISDNDNYIANMKLHKKKYWGNDWKTLFLNEMKKRYGIERIIMK